MVKIPSGAPPQLQKEESWKRQLEMYYQEQSFMRCNACKKEITPLDESGQLYTILSQCMHMIHKACLKTIVERSVRGIGEAQCPEC